MSLVTSGPGALQVISEIWSRIRHSGPLGNPSNGSDALLKSRGRYGPGPFSAVQPAPKASERSPVSVNSWNRVTLPSRTVNRWAKSLSHSPSVAFTRHR